MTSNQDLTPMTRSPFTLCKQSLHPYPRRFSPMTSASHPVLPDPFPSITKWFRRYREILPLPHLILSWKKKLVGRRAPSPPPFGVTVNFTLPFPGAAAFTSTLSELNPLSNVPSERIVAPASPNSALPPRQ